MSDTKIEEKEEGKKTFYEKNKTAIKSIVGAVIFLVLLYACYLIYDAFIRQLPHTNNELIPHTNNELIPHDSGWNTITKSTSKVFSLGPNKGEIMDLSNYSFSVEIEKRTPSDSGKMVTLKKIDDNKTTMFNIDFVESEKADNFKLENGHMSGMRDILKHGDAIEVHIIADEGKALQYRNLAIRRVNFNS